MRPTDLGDGGVDVVERDLRDAGPAPRRPGTEVGQPAVVRLQADPSPVEVAGVGGRCEHERGTREERRDRVREDDLGDDAVGLEVGEPPLVVPVAATLLAAHVLERGPVLVCPRVELVEEESGQVVAVLAEPGAAVAVGRDDDVTVVGCHDHSVARVRHSEPGRVIQPSAFASSLVYT